MASVPDIGQCSLVSPDVTMLLRRKLLADPRREFAWSATDKRPSVVSIEGVAVLAKECFDFGEAELFEAKDDFFSWKTFGMLHN